MTCAAHARISIAHVLGKTYHTKVNWLGTVAGRLGYAFDRVLVYAKGGFAFADDEHEIVDGGFVTAKGDKTRTGWMVGGGIEVAVAPNWTIKGEYNFMDFGSEDIGVHVYRCFPWGTVDIDQQIHVVKFGINYRLGGPVIARY